MKINLILICFVVIISSCGPGKDYILKPKLLHLTESEIYNEKLVYDVIFDSEENNFDSLKDKSRKLFLEGINLSKNKNNHKVAVEFFKESILTFPDAKTYYELGNSLTETGNLQDLKDALKAYEVAEYLNFQPISNIYYKSSCVNNIISEEYSFTKEDKDEYLFSAMHSLKKAFESGFSDTTSLLKDNRMVSLTSTIQYKKMVMETISKRETNGSNSFFTLFKESFPNTVGSFEIPITKVDMNEYDQSVSYDFAQFIPEMENVSFGRDVSHDFFYVAKVSETPNYTALVYSSISFYGASMQPVHTTLATYSNNGEIISKKMIACQCSAEKIKISTIDKGSIVIQDYKRVWKKPIDKVSFEENSIKNHELLAEAKYRIDENGKIPDDVVPANYQDSTIVAKK